MIMQLRIIGLIMWPIVVEMKRDSMQITVALCGVFGEWEFKSV